MDKLYAVTLSMVITR